MKTKIAYELLRKIELDASDAARLVLEAVEELGARAEGVERPELMALLRRVLREGVQAVKRAEQSVSLKEAAWQSIAARAGRRSVTLRDLRYYVQRMLRVEGVGTRSLREMSAQECRALLSAAFPHSVHSYRKGRAILHSIFAYGIRREWCDSNPVRRIETPRVKEREVLPLNAQQLEKLARAVALPEHAAMQLSLHLMTYCGVRPAEVRRLNPDTDIDWREKMVIIRPEHSKTGGGRVIPLRGAAKLRRMRCPLIIPANWERRWQQLRRAAGLSNWRADALRHTFASNHAAYYRDLPSLQLEMGHRDLTLLRTRYMNYAPPREARRFWRSINE